MYTNLGSNGSSFGRQAGTMAASFAAKTATTYGITSLLPALGSAAGPIGSIVGGIVSFLASLFGPTAKLPVFGVVALIPEIDNPALTGKENFESIVRVGRMLGILQKPPFDMGFRRKDPNFASITASIKAMLAAEPQGAIGITSGGLPTAHPMVAKLDFSKLRSHTANLAKPFNDVLLLLNDETKAAILAEPLPYKASKSYYYQIGERYGEVGPTPTTQLQNKWVVSGIAQLYDAVKISGGHDLGKSMEKAWKSIPQNINQAFIKHAGVDIMAGTVTDQVLATKAFKPQSTTAPTLVQSGLGWLALLAGGLLLL